MATSHYNFPTINGSDAIDGVNAINGLANAVDTALFAVDSAVGGAESDIAQAIADAASASAAATAASTNAAAAQSTAGAAVNTANAANSTAANTASALNTFENMFNLVPTTITSGVSVTGFTYHLTLAQDSTGSIFKFYGDMAAAFNANKSMTRVAIPGGTGNYAYGVATGLQLNQAPSSAYAVSPAGWYKALVSGTPNYTSNSDWLYFAVGTNGQIYIHPASSSGAPTFNNAWQYTEAYFPAIYFNTSFGDTPTPTE